MYSWRKCSTTRKAKKFPEGLAFHKICAVYDTINLYNRVTEAYEDITNPNFLQWKQRKHQRDLTNKKEDIKHIYPKQGVYCFGGKKENGKVTNEMKILRVDVRDYYWIIPKTKGMPPLPRYQHSMELYEPARFIVIYGGMDDHRNI